MFVFKYFERLIQKLNSFPCSDNYRKGKVDPTRSVGDGRVELLCKKATTSPSPTVDGTPPQGGELLKDIIKDGERLLFWLGVLQKINLKIKNDSLHRPYKGFKPL